VADDGTLLADFGTVFFLKIEIAIRAVKIHSRPEHMRINDKNLLASWTRYFDSLTHVSS
jgi:hypothetical protein